MKANSTAYVIISLIVTISLTLACWKINQPGLYYDELTFVNAALMGKGDIFMRFKLMGLPVLVMDYYGALKAWIYYPIFSIFPFNSISVRLPAILLGITGGIMLVTALWKGFGRFAAVAGAVMILLDPTLITHSKLDWSPNALMFFFRGLLILSLINWAQTLKPKWAWAALIALGLGIFDKLNFIWIGCAALIPTIIFYREKLKAFYKLYPIQSRILMWATATGLVASAVRAAIVAEHLQISWSERIPYALRLLRLTLSGGGALEFICGDGARLEKWFWPGYALAGMMAIAAIQPLLKNKPEKRLFLWTGSFLFLLTLAFICTKTAAGVQHSAVISGIWQFALAAMLGVLWNTEIIQIKTARIASVAAIVLIGAGSIKANEICVAAFTKPNNVNWDHVNTRAALFAKEHPDADYITGDWGMGTQIIGVTKDRPFIFDVCPMFRYPERAEEVIKGLRRDRDTYIYTRTLAFENFKGNRTNLINALDRFNIHYEISATFYDRLGRAVIEIWRVPAARSL